MICKTLKARLLGAVVGMGLCANASAEIPRFIDLEGFSRLLDGNPATTTLSEDGAIGLRPAVQQRFFDASMALGAAGQWQDEVVVARLGAQAALVAIDTAGKQRSLMPLGEALVTRIAGAGRELWVAQTQAGKASVLHWQGAPRVTQQAPISVAARFVWDVVPLPEGGALLATGEPGMVIHLDAHGKQKILFAAEEAHIKAVANDAKLGIFAGGGERGGLYHAPMVAGGKTGEFRALFDTGNQEVTALMTDGVRVFVASVSGQMVAGDEAEAPKRAGKNAEGRSALVRVEMDGSSEILAASGDELIFDVAQDGQGRVLVATGSLSKTDPRGRLYRVEPGRKVVSLVYQSASKRLLRLLPQKDRSLLIVEQQGARLVTLADGVAKEGCYLSPAVDTGVLSRFGLVQALGEVPKGSHAAISVRTGKTPEPDKTWSAWSAPIDAPGDVPVAVANGRYAQMRLQLRGKDDAQPQIYRLRLAFLRQNLPPFVHDITAMAKGLALYPLPGSSAAEDNQSKIVVVGDKTEADGPQKRQPIRARQVSEHGAVTIKWAAEEPNGDELIYTLWMRPSAGGTWRLVADELTEPFHTFHSAQLPDGQYIFRVRASDVRANPTELARTDTRESHSILIDNTPPHFHSLKAVVRGENVTITGQVRDTLSPLVSLSYALDGARLQPMSPADGLVDGPQEQVALTLTGLTPGEHVLTVRAHDEADNAGFAALRFTIAAAR